MLLRPVTRFGHAAARRCVLMLALAAAASAGGCQLAALFGGHGSQDAEYHIPKGKKVLVMVDVRPELAAPPAWASALAEQISTTIYQHKGADAMVSQEKLLDMQQHDPNFHSLGVADIAQACGADLVILVYIIDLKFVSTIDQGVTQGSAEAFVKVIDRNGNRLYGDSLGRKLDETVQPALEGDQDRDAVYRKLHDSLAIHIARLFFKYDLEDKKIAE